MTGEGLMLADLFLEGTEGCFLGLVGEEPAAVEDGLEEATGRAWRDVVVAESPKNHFEDLIAIGGVGSEDDAVVRAPVGAEDVGRVRAFVPGGELAIGGIAIEAGFFEFARALQAAVAEGVGCVMTAVTVVVKGGGAAGLVVVEEEGASGGHGHSWQKEKDRGWAVLFLISLYKFRGNYPFDARRRRIIVRHEPVRRRAEAYR